jgi:hypothetical protein
MPLHAGAAQSVMLRTQFRNIGAPQAACSTHLHVDTARVDEVEEAIGDGGDGGVAALERLAAQEVLEHLGLQEDGHVGMSHRLKIQQGFTRRSQMSVGSIETQQDDSSAEPWAVRHPVQ